MTSELTFASFDALDGAKVHRLPLEVFPNFWAYAYVARKNEYCVLIDTGSGLDKSHQDLMAGLQQVEIATSDLTHIFVTHAHIDHFGGLSKLRPLTQARIGIHELDLQTIAHHEARQAFTGRRFASFLAESGLAEEQWDQVLGMHHITESFYQSVPIDFTYEACGMRLGPFEFMHLPGHCPGHVAIRLDDVIFCGDMVVQGVTPHLSPVFITPYGGVDHYLKSLSSLLYWAKDARWILNGHDDPIIDLPSQIEATRENIRRRMRKGIDALDQPLTIEAACTAIYGNMEGYNKLLVIEKTGAYVEYLYEHGMIGIVNPVEVEQGKPARYRRLREVSESDILPKERAYVFI